MLFTTLVSTERDFFLLHLLNTNENANILKNKQKKTSQTTNLTSVPVLTSTVSSPQMPVVNIQVKNPYLRVILLGMIVLQ